LAGLIGDKEFLGVLHPVRRRPFEDSAVSHQPLG
jgi:hypothetical protein